MYPSLKSIKKYIYPLLDNPNEVCLYYNNTNDNWDNGTYSSNPNNCTHSPGYSKIMGHTHPKRISIHKQEVNYYPSYEDITFPIYNSVNQINYIVTPIGLFIATYELTDYNFNITKELHDIYSKNINQLFFPIHTMLINMRNNLSLSEIIKELTPNIILHIKDVCTNVTEYVNTNILKNFPRQDYNLSYIDINQINKLSGGRKVKTKRTKRGNKNITKRKTKRGTKKKITGGADPDGVKINGVVITKRIILIASLLNNNSKKSDYVCIVDNQLRNSHQRANDYNQSYAFEYSSGTSNLGENFPNTFLPINYIDPTGWIGKTRDLFWQTHEHLLTYLYNYILIQLPLNCRHNAYLHLEYFLKRFGCWKEIQISASFGGGIWESDYEEFTILREFVLNYDIVENDENEKEIWDEYNKPRIGAIELYQDKPNPFFIFVKRISPINYYNFLNIEKYHDHILFINVLEHIIPEIKKRKGKENITLKDILDYWHENKNDPTSSILRVIQDYNMPFHDINKFFIQKGVNVNKELLSMSIYTFNNPEPSKKPRKIEKDDTKDSAKPVDLRKYPYYTPDNLYNWKKCNPITDKNIDVNFNLNMTELNELKLQELEKERIRDEKMKLEEGETFKSNDPNVDVFKDGIKLDINEIKNIHSNTLMFKYSTTDELRETLQSRMNTKTKKDPIKYPKSIITVEKR